MSFNHPYQNQFSGTIWDLYNFVKKITTRSSSTFSEFAKGPWWPVGARRQLLQPRRVQVEKWAPCRRQKWVRISMKSYWNRCLKCQMVLEFLGSGFWSISVVNKTVMILYLDGVFHDLGGGELGGWWYNVVHPVMIIYDGLRSMASTSSSCKAVAVSHPSMLSYLI